MSFVDEYSDVYLDTYGVPSDFAVLAISIAGQAGTDPELGEPYNAGVYLYGQTGSLAGLTIDQGTAELQLLPAGPVTSFTAHPAVLAKALGAGLVNERMLATLTSGKESGNADAAVQVFSESADATIPPQVVFEFGGVVAATLTPSGFSADIWHPAALAGSWAGSGSGANGLFYTLTVDGDVRVIADIINPSATGNSTCFTLPAGYRPATAQNRPASWNNPQASNAASAPWVSVSSSGVVQVAGIEVANRQVFFDIRVPLAAL